MDTLGLRKKEVLKIPRCNMRNEILENAWKEVDYVLENLLRMFFLIEVK